MPRFMRELTANVHFYTAQVERSPIAVFHAGELVGSGVVESVSDYAIKVHGEYYVRSEYTFKYAE